MDNVLGQVRFDDAGQAHQLIHYALATGRVVFRRGQSVPVVGVACQGSLERQGWRCSDDVEAVTCPACIRNGEFRAALAQVKPLRGRKWRGLA